MALGRKKWLFAGPLRSGKRAAAIMSLIQLVRTNGHGPYAHLKDTPRRLPTQTASELDKLLPFHWQHPVAIHLRNPVPRVAGLTDANQKRSYVSGWCQ
jgi:hypothetical protein